MASLEQRIAELERQRGTATPDNGGLIITILPLRAEGEPPALPNLVSSAWVGDSKIYRKSDESVEDFKQRALRELGNSIWMA